MNHRLYAILFEVVDKSTRITLAHQSTIVQVNLCQKHLLLHQLTLNMTNDCSWNYHEQSSVILWVNCCKNKSFWQRFTCTILRAKINITQSVNKHSEYWPWKFLHSGHLNFFKFLRERNMYLNIFVEFTVLLAIKEIIFRWQPFK